MELHHNGSAALITSRPPHPPAYTEKLTFALSPGDTPPPFVPPPYSSMPTPSQNRCEVDDTPSNPDVFLGSINCGGPNVDDFPSINEQDSLPTFVFNSEGCLDYIRALRELTTFSWRKDRSYTRPLYPSSALLPLGAPGDCAARLQSRPSSQCDSNGRDKLSNADAKECLFAYELLPGKSLNTHPSGRPWRSSFERVCTPCSLEDLGVLNLHNGAPRTQSANAESAKASAAKRAAISAKVATRLQSFALGPPITVPTLHELLKYPSRALLPYCLSPALQAMLLVQHAPGYQPTSATSLVIGQRNSVTKVVAVPWECATAVADALPEASQLGPVLVVHTTGRCGSSLLIKALDYLDCAQAASEPEIFTDVHEMLERGLLKRPHAVSLLRAACLLLVHRLRADRPDRPLVVLKLRNLTATWRAAELLPEALPEAKNLLMWRRADVAIGSSDAAVVDAMESPLARAMHTRSLDGRLWSNGIKAFMRNLTRIMATPLQMPNTESSSSSCIDDNGENSSKVSSRHGRNQFTECEGENNTEFLSVLLDAEAFARHGSLGFNALNVIYAFHTATNLHRGLGLWNITLSFDSLMRGRSALLRRLLVKLNWLSLLTPKSAANLGTPQADVIFSKDTRGKFMKFPGNYRKQDDTSPAGAPREALMTDSIPTETEHMPCSEVGNDDDLQQAVVSTALIDAHAEGLPANAGGESSIRVSVDGSEDVLTKELAAPKTEKISCFKDGHDENRPRAAEVAPTYAPTDSAPADNEGNLIDGIGVPKYWASRRPLPENQYLSRRQAEAIAALLCKHSPLAEAGYDLGFDRALL